MAAVVVDTSVLLGVLDPDDALHSAARAAVMDQRSSGHTLVIPSSVLAESLVGAIRQGTAVAQRVENAIDILIDEICPIDRAIAREAANLRGQIPAIRLPDALVIATGRAADAVAVLTGCKRWQGIDHRIKLVTPGA
ncbi:type II toxin-antitoxin system VapC family toxin [Actinacidiphila oryziradicis]|uniref:Ribonuclease VapC n=1 Tax=Actinacidiphila oryziradicis TaxID=2571141 RepID=A0A4U0SPX4_9ACTN|nr:PIN domain-containing protein [Actinacidiphila oryziradicis]TKA11966.1 PIN domain-containing protein [Actinacidiphila oryziradicis]